MRKRLGRLREGRRIHKLCDRFRSAMRALGEQESVWNQTDEALLLGLQRLVEGRAESKGKTPEQIVAATITVLEISVKAAEERLEEQRAAG